MSIVLEILIACALLSWLHVLTMAAVGHLYAVKIREISLGVGPKIVKSGLLTFRLIPGGFVKFKDTEAEGIPDDVAIEYVNDAFNHKPAWVRVFIALSGCALLLVISLFLHPTSGLNSFFVGFSQIIGGALSPLTGAQVSLHNAKSFINSYGFFAVFGAVSAKMATLNLLPLPQFNGGQAIFTMLRGNQHSEPEWQNKIIKWSALLMLLLFLSWLTAVVYFAAT